MDKHNREPYGLSITYQDGTRSVYQLLSEGEIGILQVSAQIWVLKLFFPELSLQSTSSKQYVEPSTQVMLSNYPIESPNLSELIGREISIPEGWTGEHSYTLLNIWDGVPIDQNILRIDSPEAGIYEITWQGRARERFASLNLKGIARPQTEIITPLCLDEEDLIELLA